MIVIPTAPDDRNIAIQWFLDDMERGRLTVFDAYEMLAQLRLVGDVVNLERVSQRLAERGCA